MTSIIFFFTIRSFLSKISEKANVYIRQKHHQIITLHAGTNYMETATYAGEDT